MYIPTSERPPKILELCPRKLLPGKQRLPLRMPANPPGESPCINLHGTPWRWFSCLSLRSWASLTLQLMDSSSNMQTAHIFISNIYYSVRVRIGCVFTSRLVNWNSEHIYCKSFGRFAARINHQLMHCGRIEEQASLHGTYLLAELYLCSHGTYLLAELYLQWRRSCQAILDTIAHGVHVCKQREKTKLMCTQGKVAAPEVAATGINIINKFKVQYSLSKHATVCTVFNFYYSLRHLAKCACWPRAANRPLYLEELSLF